jgi:hypothetical protein
MTDPLRLPLEQQPSEERLAVHEKVLKQAIADADRRRRIRFTAATMIAAAVLGVGGGLGYLSLVAEPKTKVIESSYVFDVTNPNLVAGFVDNIFIGRVDEQVYVDTTLGWTTYRVTVQHVFKGNPGRTVLISQLGYRNWREVSVPADQPLLTPGKTYLVTTSDRGDGQQAVPGGPHSITEVTANNRADLDRKWTNAIRNQQYPPGLPPK